MMRSVPISSEQYDLLDTVAAAISNFSPETHGGVLSKFEDTMANAMVTMANGASMVAAQNAVELLIRKHHVPGHYSRKDGWKTRLMRLLEYVEFGLAECRAADLSESNWIDAISLIVEHFWCDGFTELVDSYMEKGGKLHSITVIAQMEFARQKEGDSSVQTAFDPGEKALENLFGGADSAKNHESELERILHEELNPNLGTW